jgi:hypothetical protein
LLLIDQCTAHPKNTTLSSSIKVYSSQLLIPPVTPRPSGQPTGQGVTVSSTRWEDFKADTSIKKHNHKHKRRSKKLFKIQFFTLFKKICLVLAKRRDIKIPLQISNITFNK